MQYLQSRFGAPRMNDVTFFLFFDTIDIPSAHRPFPILQFSLLDPVGGRTSWGERVGGKGFVGFYIGPDIGATGNGTDISK